MELNAKCELGWAGKEGGKGSGIEVLPVCFFGICKRHRERFSLKNTHAPSPPPFAYAQMKLTSSPPCPICFVTEELGGCDSKEMGASGDSNQEMIYFETIPASFPPEGALVSPRFLLLIF